MGLPKYVDTLADFRVTEPINQPFVNTTPNTMTPQASKEDADRTLQELKIEALVQLKMIRERMFYDVIDETASFKDRLSLAEHLVKSTPIEAEMKKLEGPKNVFQFGFSFSKPDGTTETVGNIIEGQATSVEPAAVSSGGPIPELPGEALFPEFAFVEMEDDL